MNRNVFKADYYIEEMQLPGDVVRGDMIIELSGNRKMFIDNYEKIIHYDKERIVIKGKRYLVCISGTGLTMDYYSKNDAVITGAIYEIKYE